MDVDDDDADDPSGCCDCDDDDDDDSDCDDDDCNDDDDDCDFIIRSVRSRSRMVTISLIILRTLFMADDGRNNANGPGITCSTVRP